MHLTMYKLKRSDLDGNESHQTSCRRNLGLSQNKRKKTFRWIFIFFLYTYVISLHWCWTCGKNCFIGNSLAYHTGQRFTTSDQDHDQDSSNCATFWKGAWWYKSCHYSNLNGQYLPGKESAKTVSWYHWKTSFLSLKKVEMKMRPIVWSQISKNVWKLPMYVIMKFYILTTVQEISKWIWCKMILFVVYMLCTKIIIVLWFFVIFWEKWSLIINIHAFSTNELCNDI